MASRSVFFAIVLASALTGAACYIFCGPSPSKSKRKKTNPPGLINYGKSCFLNSILQALAPCYSFNAWLGNVLQNDTTQNVSIGINTSKSLLLATFELLKYLNNQSENNKQVPVLASTNHILKALQSHRWIITNEEQDAHEMFHVLTTTLEDEIRAKMPTSSLALDSNDLASGISSRCCKTLPTVSQTVGKVHTNLPFRGLLASQLRCESCSYKSPLKFDTFDSISLPIPNRKWPHLMLQDCLRLYMLPERVNDVECERCTGTLQNNGATDCNKNMTKSSFIKQLTIGKLPELLCIHIQRMTWLSNGMPTKRYEHVIFPKHLNMSEFSIGYQSSSKSSSSVTKANGSSLVGGSINDKSTSEESSILLSSTKHISSTLTQWTSANKPLMYSLQSVVVHLGDVHSGHFVTYRRGTIGSNQRNSWYMCSDSIVYQVSFDQVLECDAYMLFYERIRDGQGENF